MWVGIFVILDTPGDGGGKYLGITGTAWNLVHNTGARMPKVISVSVMLK